MRLKLIIYQDYDIAISSSPKYGISLSLSLVNNTNWLGLRLNKIKHSVIYIKNLAPVLTQVRTHIFNNSYFCNTTSKLLIVATNAV